MIGKAYDGENAISLSQMNDWSSVSFVLAQDLRRWQTAVPALLSVFTVLAFSGCAAKLTAPDVSIRITRVPQANSAGGTQTEIIEGSASGARAEDRVVIYAWTGKWWVQPLENQPFTPLNRRMHWINGTHLGARYAALLVDPKYVPGSNVAELPKVGGPVKAVAVESGQLQPPSPYLTFSGYQWRLRTARSNRGGTLNKYAARNAWTEASGALHLQITGSPSEWTCAEMTLTQSLGYGTYSVQVRNLSGLEPAAVFTFFTYDYAAGDENRREVNFEASRWGDPSIKNGQYVVQPFHVPTNVFRFLFPPGPTVNSFEWGPGRVTFSTSNRTGKVLSQHVFGSGIPSPGLESPRLALYVYNQGPKKLAHPVEVIIDQFTYQP